MKNKLIVIALLFIWGCSTEIVDNTPELVVPNSKVTTEQVLIKNKTNITIKDLVINAKNLQTAIRIEDSSNITIDNVEIFGTDSGNGHAIKVACNKECNNIVIKNSYLHDLKLGNSEAIALNGNVNGFKVFNNRIESISNIAIDCIGAEGDSDINDQCRNGVISGNIVDYKGKQRTDYWTAAYYCDFCSDVIFENNTVIDSSLGIEVGSESKGTAKNVIVRNNTLKNITKVGVLVGSYKKKYGGVKNVTVKGNTYINVKKRTDKQYNVVDCDVEK